MSRTLTFFLLLILSVNSAIADTLEKVVVQTSAGEIVLELHASKAPVTVKNFMRYVDGGLFTNGRFHRTVTLTPDNQPNNKVKIEVIQAGLGSGAESKSLPPIKLERTKRTGLRHRNGTISMARLEPDTASSEFFICVGDQPELDFAGRRNPDGQGFAAFGRVVSGMDVVHRIHQATAAGQSLNPPILIQAVRRAR